MNKKYGEIIKEKDNEIEHLEKSIIFYYKMCNEILDTWGRHMKINFVLQLLMFVCGMMLGLSIVNFYF